MDIHSGKKTFYERPVYTVSPDGAFALCPNFSRLARRRPGYGYEGIPDPWEDRNAPEDDGIYRLDFATGKSRPIISLAQLIEIGEARNYRQVSHWTNHLLIAPDSRRFAFLHRRRKPGTRDGRLHQFLTADTDGRNLRVLNDGQMTSHFNWRDPATLLVWAGRPEKGNRYYLVEDRDVPVFAAVGEGVLTEDGHMSYRPGVAKDWFVTDTYPAKSDRCRALILFNDKTGEYRELGRFYADPKYDGPERCDLRPRWSRDGAAIFFDSLHDGARQVYKASLGL